LNSRLLNKTKILNFNRARKMNKIILNCLKAALKILLK